MQLLLFTFEWCIFFSVLANFTVKSEGAVNENRFVFLFSWLKKKVVTAHTKRHSGSKRVREMHDGEVKRRLRFRRTRQVVSPICARWVWRRVQTSTQIELFFFMKNVVLYIQSTAVATGTRIGKA